MINPLRKLANFLGLIRPVAGQPSDAREPAQTASGLQSGGFHKLSQPSAKSVLRGLEQGLYVNASRDLRDLLGPEREKALLGLVDFLKLSSLSPRQCAAGVPDRARDMLQQAAPLPQSVAFKLLKCVLHPEHTTSRSPVSSAQALALHILSVTPLSEPVAMRLLECLPKFGRHSPPLYGSMMRLVENVLSNIHAPSVSQATIDALQGFELTPQQASRLALAECRKKSELSLAETLDECAQRIQRGAAEVRRCGEMLVILHDRGINYATLCGYSMRR